MISIEPSFSWINLLKSNIQNSEKNNKDIVLVSQNLVNTGVIGLTKSLRQELNGSFIK